MKLDWSGLDGVRVGQAIRQGRMDSDVADIMRRKQEENAGNYETDMGLDGAVGQAEGLRRQTDDFGVEGQKATITALNSNARDTTPAASRAYTLGDHSRDTAYTPEEVKGLNRRDTRDMLVSKWGKEGRQAESEMGAEDLRGIQTEVAKGQLDDYKKAKKLEMDLAENAKASNFGRAAATDSAAMEEFTKKKVLYDSMPPETQAGVKPPVAPEPTKLTPIQSLSDAIAEQAVKARQGKHDINAVISLTSTMDKLKDEGVKKTMLVADRTGDPVKIADSFNESGDHKVDPANIKTREIKLPDGSKTYEVTTFDPATGQSHTVNARDELNSMVSAEKNFDELNKKADQFTQHQYKMAEIGALNRTRGSAANLKYSTMRDKDGNLFYRDADGAYYDAAGNLHDASTNGSLYTITGNTEPKPIDRVKAQAEYDKFVTNNPRPPELKGFSRDSVIEKRKVAQAAWDAEAVGVKSNLGLDGAAPVSPTAPAAGLVRGAPASMPAPAPAKRTQIPGAPAGYTTDGVNNYNAEGILLKKKGK